MQAKRPLILASGSRARAAMLQNAGVEFEKIPANIDEDGIIRQFLTEADSDFEIHNFKIVPSDCEASEGRKPSAQRVKNLALTLAQQKALHISSQNPDAYVIGSDQILEQGGQLFQKAGTIGEAREKLKTLRGKTHHLISSVAIAKGNKIIWHDTDTAKMTMDDFDDDMLEEYLALAKEDILSCVGAYAFENHGAWLFKEIDANYFTILGMPLLPLLGFLKEG